MKIDKTLLDSDVVNLRTMVKTVDGGSNVGPRVSRTKIIMTAARLPSTYNNYRMTYEAFAYGIEASIDIYAHTQGYGLAPVAAAFAVGAQNFDKAADLYQDLRDGTAGTSVMGAKLHRYLTSTLLNRPRPPQEVFRQVLNGVLAHVLGETKELLYPNDLPIQTFVNELPRNNRFKKYYLENL